MWRRALLLAVLGSGLAAFDLGQVKPPDAPTFQPPEDIHHPKSPDEPPGAPEKTTGTVQSYERGKSLVLTTADGSRSFDLAHAEVSGDTDFEVGDQVTVVKVVRPNGQVILAIAKEAPPE
jgi:hypothetical protein